MEENKELSYGEKAVGLTFNPSNLLSVQAIKQNIANVIDDLNKTREDEESKEVKRMCAVAITELQAASMWAVKALTWKD